jgi:hypothetical protein
MKKKIRVSEKRGGRRAVVCLLLVLPLFSCTSTGSGEIPMEIAVENVPPLSICY